ncbi:putative beta-lysine N-acetyltransferase [Planctomycetota bacterium]
MTDTDTDTDTVERVGNSLIQHGPLNDRIYLMKFGQAEAPELISSLDELADEKGYTKIFAKVPTDAKPLFKENGYRQEAEIPGFFEGVRAAHFLAKYRSEERSRATETETIQKIMEIARRKHKTGLSRMGQGRDGYRLDRAKPSDVSEMSKVYRGVFETYPFPIHDPRYLLQTMKSHVHYFCARAEGRIVALSSAEIDRADLNVEMTDFATLPSQLGNGLAARLLARMEASMRELGLRTAYTIARALSAGMNITFSKLGYQHGGTLTNNTNISGDIESMNVWYKPL